MDISTILQLKMRMFQAHASIQNWRSSHHELLATQMNSMMSQSIFWRYFVLQEFLCIIYEPTHRTTFVKRTWWVRFKLIWKMFLRMICKSKFWWPERYLTFQFLIDKRFESFWKLRSFIPIPSTLFKVQILLIDLILYIMNFAIA